MTHRLILQRRLDVMAELGALANIAAVVAAGINLSLALYTISMALKDVGSEIRIFSSQITIHCDVIRRVQKTLNEAKGSRISDNAIQTTQNALDGSQYIFAQLRAIISKFLKKNGTAEFDVLTRIKWMYQKTKIKWLQETLSAFCGQLQLMLTTMSYAQLWVGFFDAEAFTRARTCTGAPCHSAPQYVPCPKGSQRTA